MCVTTVCVVVSSLGWIIRDNVQVSQSDTCPLCGIRRRCNQMGFAFKVAAWGTDDHQSSNYFNTQLKGGKMGSGNNLWAINTLWLWRSEDGGLKKWNSIEWRWIKGALVVNNYTKKKGDRELHPLDPSCRYWCYHPVCRWFRNCSGAWRASNP